MHLVPDHRRKGEPLVGAVEGDGDLLFTIFQQDVARAADRHHHLLQPVMGVEAAADAFKRAEDVIGAADVEGHVLARFQRNQAATLVAAKGRSR